MAQFITKIKFHNYKKFRNYTLILDEKLNIIVGDNDAGKSSILTAIDLVLNASNSKIASYGYENLMNTDAVKEFLEGDRDVENLPETWIEIYLCEMHDHNLNGKNNSESETCDGLKLSIVPNTEMHQELMDYLTESQDTFPYDYYHTSYKTFAGDGYSYRKYLRSLMIDNTKGNDDHAINDFVRDAYKLNLEDAKERADHHAHYRLMKNNFASTKLTNLNTRLGDGYSFQVKTSNRQNLETDLSLLKDGVPLDNRGKGSQVIIKADMTLKRSRVVPDIILVEEPENHLSHTNMNKLIDSIKNNEGQLIISTHSNLISSRLDLKKCILINSASGEPLTLSLMSSETAEYFMKAPPHNALDFVLSNKVILVEGAAEYILMQRFYQAAARHNPEDDNVHIISVSGTAFKRYLDIAKILNVKTAVIRDNDGNTAAVRSLYTDYESDDRKVFMDRSNNNNTFEVSFYQANTTFCDGLFSASRRSLTVQEYMLKNKADVALEVLSNYGDNVTIPAYIIEAIEWIRR